MKIKVEKARKLAFLWLWTDNRRALVIQCSMCSCEKKKKMMMMREKTESLQQFQLKCTIVDYIDSPEAHGGKTMKWNQVMWLEWIHTLGVCGACKHISSLSLQCQLNRIYTIWTWRKNLVNVLPALLVEIVPRHWFCVHMNAKRTQSAD